MSLIFQILNITANYCGALSKEKKNIIAARIFSACFNAMAILTGGNYIASLSVFFTVIRNIVCFIKDKFKTNIPIYLITIGYLIIGTYTVINSETITDLLPVFISTVTALVMWFGSSSSIKVITILGCILWTTFYLIDGIYLTAVYNIIQLLLEFITLIRIRLNKQTKV